jgi:hypothetical protein
MNIMYRMADLRSFQVGCFAAFVHASIEPARIRHNVISVRSTLIYWPFPVLAGNLSGRNGSGLPIPDSQWYPVAKSLLPLHLPPLSHG